MLPAKNHANTTLTLFALLFLFTTPGCGAAQGGETGGHASPATSSETWDFDNVPVGQLPAGWKVAATRRRGPLATWRVIDDPTAPSADRVLALTRPNHHFGGTFNLCWTDRVSFLDGEVRVRFKAVAGREDQGGGVIWRARDENNYYIARFNPLEDNFRVYSVHDGVRRTLAGADIALSAGKWHRLIIRQHGTRFEGYLDGKKLVQGTDDLYTTPGGVGVWTKADAVTLFDDFSIAPATPEDAD